MWHGDRVNGCLPACPPQRCQPHIIPQCTLPAPLLQGKVILYSPKHIPKRNGPPEDLPLLEPTERQSHYYLLYRGTVRHRRGDFAFRSRSCRGHAGRQACGRAGIISGAPGREMAPLPRLLPCAGGGGAAAATTLAAAFCSSSCCRTQQTKNWACRPSTCAPPASRSHAHTWLSHLSPLALCLWCTTSTIAPTLLTPSEVGCPFCWLCAAQLLPPLTARGIQPTPVCMWSPRRYTPTQQHAHTLTSICACSTPRRQCCPLL